ncbi:1816_t:CDS:2 [Entrophospora sp. SA101]|nr:1816_t:CDS:2 [Entrophospora sp. SA101]
MRLARIIDYLYTQSEQITNLSKKEYLSLGVSFYDFKLLLQLLQPLRIITLQNSYKNKNFLPHLPGRFLTLNNGYGLEFPTQKISSLKVKKTLISLGEILVEQRNNLGQDETQLTALAVSSGLLTQQCEDLSKKLTASEQKEAQTKLEKEIQVNLLQQKDQEEKIKNYQNILRQAEANLTNCQKIITTKSEELTKLEEEKEKINEELETAQEKIKDLETNFLASQTKIMELEARIQELEKDNTELAQIKLKEKQLAEKIQALKARIQELEKDNSNSQELEKIKKELEKPKETATTTN